MTFPDAIASEVECDGGLGDTVAGVWLANARGLFHVTVSLPDDGLPDPSTWELAVDASPHEQRTECADSAKDGDVVGSELFEQTYEGAWCVRRGACEGDDLLTERCFTERGIVRGRYASGGGTLSEIEYTLVSGR